MFFLMPPLDTITSSKQKAIYYEFLLHKTQAGRSQQDISVKTHYKWHSNQVHNINRARQPGLGCMLRHLTKSEDEETLTEGGKGS